MNTAYMLPRYSSVTQNVGLINIIIWLLEYDLETITIQVLRLFVEYVFFAYKQKEFHCRNASFAQIHNQRRRMAYCIITFTR